jgi:hypothetical protein
MEKKVKISKKLDFAGVKKMISHILGGYFVEYYQPVGEKHLYIFENDGGHICVELWDELCEDMLFCAKVAHNDAQLSKKIAIAYNMAIA